MTKFYTCYLFNITLIFSECALNSYLLLIYRNCIIKGHKETYNLGQIYENQKRYKLAEKYYLMGMIY